MKLLAKKILKPSLLLTVVLLLVLILEIQQIYTNVYQNLDTEIESVQTGNIVRLDLTNYNKTLNVLDTFRSFTPDNKITANPFR